MEEVGIRHLPDEPHLHRHAEVLETAGERVLGLARLWLEVRNDLIGLLKAVVQQLVLPLPLTVFGVETHRHLEALPVWIEAVVGDVGEQDNRPASHQKLVDDVLLSITDVGRSEQQQRFDLSRNQCAFGVLEILELVALADIRQRTDVLPASPLCLLTAWSGRPLHETELATRLGDDLLDGRRHDGLGQKGDRGRNLLDDLLSATAVDEAQALPVAGNADGGRRRVLCVDRLDADARALVEDRFVVVRVEPLHDDFAVAQLHQFVEEVLEHRARVAQLRRKICVRAEIGLDHETLLQATDQGARRVRQRVELVTGRVDAGAVARG